MKLLNFYRDITFKLMVKLKEANAKLEAAEQMNLTSSRKATKASNRFIRIHLDLVILAYATLRFWSISLMMYLGYEALPLWKVDYYARWVYDFRHRFDPFGPLMFWLWTVLIFALSRSLSRLPQQAFTFDLFYQIVVSSRLAYQRSLYSADQLETIVAKRRKILLQRAIQKSALFWLIFGSKENPSSIVARQAAAVYCFLTLENVNQRRFVQLRGGRLDCMPSLSVFWRLQVARWGLFIDGVMFYALIIASLVVFSFCSLFLAGAAHRLPFPTGLVVAQILLENLIVLVSVLRLLRCLSLLFVVTPVIAFVFRRHLQKAALVRRLLQEHHRLTRVLCTTNAQFFSAVTLALMAVLLPNNIYFVGYFFYREHEPVFRNFLLVAIIFTSCSGVSSVLPATTTECLVEPVRFISKMQINLRGREENRGLKIKLDGLMAAMCAGTGTGLSFTVGPLANITVAGIYEFLGFYTGYLLFAFGNFM
ncbi:hypothetical protein TYRP_003173 [Tyrophagus putrescentiae]|nr:hypothetical protein TYRP_003173 [Tyrophagus putrescentiae]